MFRAQIRNGRPHYPTRFAQFCAEREGRWLEIDLIEPERSISQLRLYRAWLHNTAQHTGNDEEALHGFLLEKCAPRVVVTIKGPNGSVDIEQIKRTSGGHQLSMDKSEMAEYMMKCAELTGYPLPTEEQLIEMGYMPH